MPYSYVFHQKVVWGDMDSFGHVNNVAYIRYFESARADYFSEFHFWSYNPSAEESESRKEGPVLVRVEMDYRKQVHYPSDLQIQIGLESISKKGFQIGCEMYEGDKLVAKGLAQILWYDFQDKKVTLLPPSVVSCYEREKQSRI